MIQKEFTGCLFSKINNSVAKKVFEFGVFVNDTGKVAQISCRRCLLLKINLKPKTLELQMSLMQAKNGCCISKLASLNKKRRDYRND